MQNETNRMGDEPTIIEKFPSGCWTAFDENGTEYSHCRCGLKVYSDEELDNHISEKHSETTLLDVGYMEVEN